MKQGNSFLYINKELIQIFRSKLLHLIHCQSLTNKNIWFLLRDDPQLERLYQTSFTHLPFTPQKIYQFQKEFNQIQIDKLEILYKNHGIHYLTYFDAEYPELLREIYNPPLVLFYKGNLEILTKKALAIVGARDANHYGRQVLNKIIPPIIEKKIVIVSGLAKGIDTFAHVETVRNDGRTIAVLGGGFFHIYPKENETLAKQIAKEHLLISEYPPIEKPAKWKFPMRNRIISGLTQGTLVVQAKERSGSLITADFALEQGREVFAIPGNISDLLSAGTNDLIQQGAKLVMHAEHIIEELYP